MRCDGTRPGTRSSGRRVPDLYKPRGTSSLYFKTAARGGFEAAQAQLERFDQGKGLESEEDPGVDQVEDSRTSPLASLRQASPSPRPSPARSSPIPFGGGITTRESTAEGMHELVSPTAIKGRNTVFTVGPAMFSSVKAANQHRQSYPQHPIRYPILNVFGRRA